MLGRLPPDNRDTQIIPDADAVLFANEAFYRAFADRDPDAMDDLWSRTAPVSCIHPGWGVIFGRDEVMESWIAIISGAGTPRISCHGASASLYGDVAFVVCFEKFVDNVLIATNVFVREGQVSKMVHHQAGPTTAEPPTEAENEMYVPVH